MKEFKKAQTDEEIAAQMQSTAAPAPLACSGPGAPRLRSRTAPLRPPRAPRGACAPGLSPRA